MWPDLAWLTATGLKYKLGVYIISYLNFEQLGFVLQMNSILTEHDMSKHNTRQKKMGWKEAPRKQIKVQKSIN